jgi:hypothetical protein
LGLSSEILVGLTTTGNFGADGNSVISLSSDGRVVAVNDILNDTNGTDTGQVRVFELSANVWRQRGQLINGKTIASYGLGYNIALSGNGNIIAASSLTRPSPRNGEILVYEFSANANSWIQMGQDISGVGGANYNDLGFSMSLSLDGTTLAAGYRSATPSRVEIYTFNSSSRTWSLPINNVIYGSAIDQYFGWNIKLSGDGNTIVIGGIGYGAPIGNTSNGIGSVSVFKYNGTSWPKLGQTIYGASANDLFGQWVQISNDGTIISAGGSITGVRVYKLSSNVWTQIGQVLNGTGVAPNLGLAGHALSGDGTTLFQMINKSGGNLSRVYGIIDNNLNTPNKQWLMYLNTLSSISGDDLTIKPDARRNLLLEVSGNNNIFIKKGTTSYNLTNLITGDASFSNVDVSRNLNPLISTQALGTGGNVTISGGYIIHSFTTPRSYTGSSGFIPAFSGNVEVLLVGGGGGGGSNLGGGGGGGGVIYMPSVSVVAGTSYPVVVGAGGSSGNNGEVSRVFDASAAGGGTSGSWPNGDGSIGGSGGGAAANDSAAYNSRINQGGASSGNSLGPNSGFIYGNRGGHMTSIRLTGPTRAAGGGGAGGQAVDTNSNITGNTGQTGMGSGGVGIPNSILGTTYYWAGGGGGGAWDYQVGGYGGLGGGGGGAGKGGVGLGGGSALYSGANGSLGSNAIGGAGGANTGGGGGGGTYISGLGGAGGSGIVVIRYSPSLGIYTKAWGNAYIRDISVTNMSVSETISNVRQIIPQITNDISTSLGNSSNIWQRAFINDLSGISSINGTSWSTTGLRGPRGLAGQPGLSGPPGPPGPPGAIGSAGTTITGTWRDISNLTLTTYNRIYQNLNMYPKYELNISYLTWLQHKARAERSGKTLAVILDASQNQQVKIIAGGSSVYIGGLRTSNSSTADGKTSADWQWVNGDTWSYTNFSSGEPNSTGEQYIEMWPSGAWNDTNGNYGQQAVYMSYEDPSWNAVTGYYGLAKDAYPSLNPYSNGDLAVITLTLRNLEMGIMRWNAIAWSPELRIFTVGSYTGTGVMTSRDGITWTSHNQLNGETRNSIVWSSQLKLFVAVLGGGSVATSSDGINWTFRGLGFSNAAWYSVCWAAELGIFVAVGLVGTNNRVMTSTDGINWTRGTNIPQSDWLNVVWSPELKIFVAVSVGTANYAMTSSNGINWTMQTNSLFNYEWRSLCWSPQLGIFVALGQQKILISNNGINWNFYSSTTTIGENSICWSPELGLFFSTGGGGQLATSSNGINWTTRTSSGYGYNSICWSPELGMFVAVSTQGYVLTSSLKGRPPTSYNVFDSSFNRIDENGKWDFQNMNVTTLTVNGATVNSDDRLKHNEVVITNGLKIIDRLTPKFYQKTQVMLDASYNGDLNGHAWSHEAGLIAQEVLQISDLSYVVGGGDYYEQKYIYNRQTNDLSANYYELSNNYYEPSANYYELSNNYYEVSYNYYEVSNNYYEISTNYYEPSANNYEISYNLVAKAYNLNYNSVFVYGLAAIKELHTKVKAQESTILNQKNIISSLLARVEALENKY